MRTDDNNNPTAFTTGIAMNAGLLLGTDYEVGTPFQSSGVTYNTAKLLGDPVEITKRVIDKIGFLTKDGHPRWIYINVPKILWLHLTDDQKRITIGEMYRNEGGVAMRNLFPDNFQSGA